MDAGKTGELIAALRKEKGWSQTELAKRLGVTNKAVSRWETGRGYPDVELLPLIAQTLDITISELLEGEHSAAPQETAEQRATRSEGAGQGRKKRSAAVLCAAAVLGILLAVGLYPRALGFVNQIIGVPECIIGAEYDHLTYYGKRYVPIFLGEADCALGVELVSECQVEGSGFLGKLFFGERLWEVRGVPDYELVYLQTEYDDCLSPYFVLEARKEHYEAMVRRAEYTQTYVWYAQEDDLGRELRVELDTELLEQAAQGAPAEEKAWADPDRRLEVMAYEENHLFYRLLGELLYKDGSCFWIPSRVWEQSGTLTYGLTVYPVSGDPFPDS